MEEIREQPAITPAPALNPAEENVAVSETGSQDNLGKFKSVQALMDAYTSLQSEFTKKCQLLSQYQKDKTDNTDKDNEESKEEKVESDPQEKEDFIDQSALDQFLENNDEAKQYLDEIKQRFGQGTLNSSPYEIAWANVVLSHMKGQDKTSDPIINQYVLSDENVKNKIIESYLNDLKSSRPPITISSRSGERVSAVLPDAPKSLADAKRLVDKMFE